MELMERIEQVLEEKVRPQLRSHGGDIAVKEFADGILRIRLLGQCAGCPSADFTSEGLVKEEVLAAVPEVRDVVLVQEVSDELYDFAKRILQGHRPE